MTVDGVPVHEVNVTFSPASGNGQPGFGSTDAKGRYHLSTAGAPFQSGALAGEYVPTFSKVQLEERPPAKSAEEQIARDSVSPPKTLHLIPERYGHRDTCGLDSVTIKKGEKNVFDFKLTSE